jgi:hypothetical protein
MVIEVLNIKSRRKGRRLSSTEDLHFLSLHQRSVSHPKLLMIVSLAAMNEHLTNGPNDKERRATSTKVTR